MTAETTSGSEDIFAGLLQDHARIEAQLKALLQAAGTLSRTESDIAALEVVDGTLGFFATEGARHEEVEELTLFPRFRHRPAFKQILSALEFQHGMNRTAERELRECVARFAPGRGPELKRLAIRFAEMHRGHAVAEERALFPLAAPALAPEEIAEMTREARERRRGPPGNGANGKEVR